VLQSGGNSQQDLDWVFASFRPSGMTVQVRCQSENDDDKCIAENADEEEQAGWKAV